MTQGSQLRCYMNLMAFDSLPKDSLAPAGSRKEQFMGLRESGFGGVQFAGRPSDEEMTICRSLGLGLAGSGRVNAPAEAMALAQESAAIGYECVTLHVGWGLEDDDEAFRLIESILEASDRTRVPFYVETHRATIFQDMWRTVNFTQRYPQLRFNGDFSHWYTGQEMVYGSFEKKFAYIKPVMERVRFIHGRVANPGCIQVEGQRRNSASYPLQTIVDSLLPRFPNASECFRVYLLHTRTPLAEYLLCTVVQRSGTNRSLERVPALKSNLHGHASRKPRLTSSSYSFDIFGPLNGLGNLYSPAHHLHKMCWGWAYSVRHACRSEQADQDLQ